MGPERVPARGVLALVVAFASIAGLPGKADASGWKPTERASRSWRPPRAASCPTGPAGPAADDGNGAAAAWEAPLRHLFAKGWAPNTVLLWVPFFTTFGLLVVAVLWTPVLLRDNGFAPMQAGIVLGVHGAGAILGMASAGHLMTRVGSGPVLGPALLVGAIATGAFGFASTSLAVMSATMALVGIFVGLAASGSIALATLAYPPSMRASGLGWAMGMGRFGQVVAPQLAAMLVSFGWRGKEVLLSLAIMPLFGAAATALLWRLRAYGGMEPLSPIVTLHRS